MKILMITPYVTITSRPEFSRNKTGFGYMVYDIAKAISVTENVDILCTDSIGNAFTDNNIRFLKRSWIDFGRLIFNCVSFSLFLSLLKQYRMSKGSLARLLYYWIISGYVSKIILQGNYDLVHIHGCSFSGTFWECACKRYGVKVVYTLHGLNSFSDAVNLESAAKQYERDFLCDVASGMKKISVISSGMRNVILSNYNRKDNKSVVVINNAFSFPKSTRGKVDVRSEYNIPFDAHIVLCVGNISERKNQKQLILSFNLLPEELKNRTYILFLGNKLDTNDGIDQLIRNSEFSNHLILCGAVEKELVSCYYEQGDSVALISKSEGFGLSLIEGMHFGLPCMTFTDVDAYEDIFDACAVVGVANKDNESVATGLRTLIDTRWDKDAIKQYSKKFELDTMRNKYCNWYRTI